MNKRKYITFPLLLSLLCINNVYAICNDESKKEFEELEKQYKITTSFNSDTKAYNMKIQTDKNKKFKYVFDINYKYECKEINNTTTECYGLKPGTSFYYYILGNTKECNEFITEEIVKLPKLNEFYGDPLCDGIEEFVLCQEIYEREIDRETFEKRIESYKESKKEKQQIEEQKNNEKISVIKKILNYIKENLVQVIIVVIFIILLVINIITRINTSRKSRRLE